MFLIKILITIASLGALATGGSLYGAPGEGADLIFFGDAMQHQGQLDRARELGTNGSYNYDDCFTLIAPTVKEADFAVVNLEVPLGGGNDYSGYPCFSAPDSYAVALKDAGFDLFLTANNHCLDRRDKGLRRTITALDSLGIDHIGTYTDTTERKNRTPYIKNINGIRVGFLNYTYGTNGIEATQGAEVALIDRDKIAREMKQTRDAGAEILVVAMHWGVEYVLTENANQRSLADFLVENGADLIIGSHPHVIQPMKVVHNDKEDKDVLIVYSLGNVISNMNTDDTRGGALVRARIERNADGIARFKSANYDTFYSAKPSGGRTNFRVIPSWMEDSIPAAQRNRWLIFDRSATRIFDTHNVNVPRLHNKNQQ